METISTWFSCHVRIFGEKDVDLLALLQPELLPLLLSYFQLELNIVGLNSSFPIYGQYLDGLQRNLFYGQSTKQHWTCKPAKGQLLHPDTSGAIPSNEDILQMRPRSWPARLPEFPTKNGEKEVMGSREPSEPPPPVRAVVDTTKDLLLPEDRSSNGGKSSPGPQSQQKSNAVSSAHGDTSIAPQDISPQACGPRDKDAIEDHDQAGQVDGCRLGSIRCPSPSLPYRPQRSTPLRAPPHTSELPMAPSLSTIQASFGAPQVATQQTATQTCRLKRKPRQERKELSKSSKALSSAPKDDSQEACSVDHVSLHNSFGKDEKRHRNVASIHTQAPSPIPDLLKLCEIKVVDVRELSGIKQAAGDSTTQRGNGPPPSRTSGSASGTNHRRGLGQPPGLSKSGGPGGSGGSGGGRQPSANTQLHEATPTKKQQIGLPFRCPIDAANPGEHDRKKCKDWHNVSIAAVTRHALGDLGEDSDKGTQIKALSHDKFSPGERWKRYFVIANNGIEDPEMNQPYWVHRDPDDTMREILKVLIAHPSSGTRSSATTLRLLHQYENLLAGKEQIDRQIRARCEATKAAAMETEQQALKQSQSEFNVAFEYLMVGIDEHNDRIPGSTAMDFSAVPGNQDLQGLTSLDQGNLDIDAGITTPLGHGHNHTQLMMPVQAPHNYGNASLGLSHGNLPNMTSQPLNEFIHNTEVVMNSQTSPRMQQQVQQQQNENHQKTQSLRPPRYHPYAHRGSAPGSSRRSAADASSAGSPDDTSANSFEILAPPSMSSVAYPGYEFDAALTEFDQIDYARFGLGGSFGNH